MFHEMTRLQTYFKCELTIHVIGMKTSMTKVISTCTKVKVLKAKSNYIITISIIHLTKP
jgi:hypothetical protein